MKRCISLIVVSIAFHGITMDCPPKLRQDFCILPNKILTFKNQLPLGYMTTLFGILQHGTKGPVKCSVSYDARQKKYFGFLFQVPGSTTGKELLEEEDAEQYYTILARQARNEGML